MLEGTFPLYQTKTGWIFELIDKTFKWEIKGGIDFFYIIFSFYWPIILYVLKFQTLSSFLFSYKILVIRAVNHIMLDRKANREDPDQTAV